MRQDIKGFNNHPDIFKLREYVEITPGKSKNGLPTFVSARKLP